MVVPVPACVRAPVPLMVLFNVQLLLRLNANVPLLVMAPVCVPKLPVLPPLPNCRVPALMVVVPV